MKTWMRFVGGAWVLATLGAGCGSMSNDSSAPNAGFTGGGADNPGNSATGPSAGGGTGAADAAAALPSEIKSESNYQSPVATGQIVWTANPTSGRVAYIDATTFVVQTVQAGDGPTYLAAVPDPVHHDDVAIVLNVLSHDATLLRRDASGTLTTASFATTPDANSWAVAPSGHFAVAWTNATQIANADPAQGFQDIAVLDLQAGRATTLAIGYRPSQIVFSHDETRAFAVTQDGISVVQLTAGSQPALAQNFPLALAIPPDASTPQAMDAAADGATDGLAPAPDGGEAGATPAMNAAAPASGMPDVSFTPDGAYALVRQDGLTTVSVISLADGSTTSVVLPYAPTDLTVSPDGAFAVAVLRDVATVALLPLPGIVSAPTAFTTIAIAGETIGRAIVTKDPTTGAHRILLFTTAAPVEEMTVLTLEPTPSYRTVALHAPVLAVFPTDDAQNAVVLHSMSATPKSAVKRAFSIVPVAQALPAVITSLPATPTAVALASDRALVALRDDTTATYGVCLAMMSSRNVLQYSLASPPIAVGIAAASSTGYVAQTYVEGRITFVGLDAGGIRTITGFELGARVVQGGDQ